MIANIATLKKYKSCISLMLNDIFSFAIKYNIRRNNLVNKVFSHLTQSYFQRNTHSSLKHLLHHENYRRYIRRPFLSDLTVV